MAMMVHMAVRILSAICADLQWPPRNAFPKPSSSESCWICFEERVGKSAAKFPWGTRGRIFSWTQADSNAISN